MGEACLTHTTAQPHARGISSLELEPHSKPVFTKLEDNRRAARVTLQASQGGV